MYPPPLPIAHELCPSHHGAETSLNPSSMFPVFCCTRSSLFGRMIALVRIKGATRQRGLKLRLQDLGKIWIVLALAPGNRPALQAAPYAKAVYSKGPHPSTAASPATVEEPRAYSGTSLPPRRESSICEVTRLARLSHTIPCTFKIGVALLLMFCLCEESRRLRAVLFDVFASRVALQFLQGTVRAVG